MSLKIPTAQAEAGGSKVILDKVNIEELFAADNGQVMSSVGSRDVNRRGVGGDNTTPMS